MSAPWLLCLTCSSSSPHKPTTEPFYTKCCSRRICDNCLHNNPRLRAYNPCLVCLGGVEASSKAAVHLGSQPWGNGLSGLEVNGVVEQDMFILGDDDEIDDGTNPMPQTVNDPPPYTASEPVLTVPDARRTSSEARTQPEEDPSVSQASRYYIKPGDTLAGISLKLGIDGRRLARLNSLPISTLSTTPHILHTRHYLTLPPGSDTRSPSSPPPGTEENRMKERAAKRLAFVTKETDYRVAKAYVAVAEVHKGSKKMESSQPSFKLYTHEPGYVSGESHMESRDSRAIDAYLDDAEWEEAERRAGRGPRIMGFPYFPLPDAHTHAGAFVGKLFSWTAHRR